MKIHQIAEIYTSKIFSGIFAEGWGENKGVGQYIKEILGVYYIFLRYTWL
jgi:hypothetical protein